MLRIRFELNDNSSSNLSSFALGDMVIEGGLYTATSAEQSMMILPSIPLLLDGIRNFLKGRHEQFDFIGVDCSFRVSFKKTKSGTIQISHKSEMIDEVSENDLVTAILVSIKDFIDHPTGGLNNILTKRDSVVLDLYDSLAEFKNSFK